MIRIHRYRVRIPFVIRERDYCFLTSNLFTSSINREFTFVRTYVSLTMRTLNGDYTRRIFDLLYSTFCPALQECVHDISKMGRLFVTHERKLWMYASYCQNKRICDFILNEYISNYFEVMFYGDGFLKFRFYVWPKFQWLITTRRLRLCWTGF